VNTKQGRQEARGRTQAAAQCWRIAGRTGGFKHLLGVGAACVLVLGACPIAALAQDQQPATGATPPPKAEAPPTLQLPLAVTLTANPSPARFDMGEMGPVYLTSVISGFAQVQSNVTLFDRTRQFDVDNLQVFLNKPTGMLQFFVQAGQYSIPVVGVPYLRSVDATPTYFTYVPQAYVKFVPNERFSVMAGKLPTMIGAESTFTFQNMNIQRGLVWNQENAVNRGVQVNYNDGPLTLAASVNDGFYSNRYSWISLSAIYAVDKANTVALVAAGNTNHTDVSTARTPLFQNNQQIYNAIYTYSSGPWTVQPYLQYTHVPRLPQFGATESASTYGAALLASYDFGSDAAPAAVRTPGLKLPVRIEYISSTGSATSGAPNLLYGPGSAAWSFTLTPTYQYKNYFFRAEFSYVGTSDTSPGSVFGRDGNKGSQVRGAFELGLVF
jgi:hypothetical protein